MLYSELITQHNTINSIEQYVEMARRKTGKLYALAVDLSSNYNESLITNYDTIHDAFEKIGIAHQMLDDRLDYLRPESFQTDAAFENAKRNNYYALTELGFTMEHLDEIHIEIGTTALNDIEELIVVDSK
jgi:geranylgeranyl pyrophosphate synthase